MHKTAIFFLKNFAVSKINTTFAPEFGRVTHLSNQKSDHSGGVSFRTNIVLTRKGNKKILLYQIF